MRYKDTEVGIIPESWEVKQIKEVTEIVTDYVANGSFASLAENVKYKDEPDEAVLIRLVDYNNDFNGNFVFIDSHAYEFLGKSKLFGGEIIISNVGAKVGTVFRCPTLKYKMSLAPNSVMVKFKENDDFYFHWLRGYNGQSMLKSIVTGSAQPKFNKTNFREMLVPVPPVEEQTKIANILNSIDEKIDLNNGINKNLEEQIHALTNDMLSNPSSDWAEVSLNTIA
ncbi:MAG: restriction endonuclease subunit S, partial [Finegoldia magna]|nr:restriction endonuclease subunit S [Finegoldia magna]